MARDRERDDDDRDQDVDREDDRDEPDQDDRDDDAEDEDDGESDDDGGAPSRDRRTKAELLAELDRKSKALTRARKDARRARTRRPAPDDDRRPPARTDDDRDRRDDRRDGRDREADRRRDDRDREADRERDRREVKAEQRALVSGAEAALLRAGADPELAELAAGRVREGDVDWDGDDPDFTDWVDDMRERRPALFRQGRSRDDREDERPRRRRSALDQGEASQPPRRVKEGDLSFGQRVMRAGQRADSTPPSRRARR